MNIPNLNGHAQPTANRTTPATGMNPHNVLAEIQLLSYNAPKEGLRKIEELLPLLQRLDDPWLLCYASVLLVRTQQILGMHREAAQAVLRAQKLENRLHSPKEKGFFYNFLCSYYTFCPFPDLSRAYRYNIKAWEHVREIDNDYLRAIILSQRGSIYSALLEPDKALECYLRGKEYAFRQRRKWQRTDNASLWKAELSISIAFANIASIYNQIDEIATAYDHFKSSYRYAKKAGNIYKMAEARHAAGFMLTKQGRNNEALANYYSSLKLSRQAGLEPLEIAILCSIANCYSQADNPESARKHLDQAFVISNRLQDDKSRTKLLVTYANFLVQTGDLKQGEKFYLEAEAIKSNMTYRQELLDIYHALIKIYMQTGEVAAARNYRKKYRRVTKALSGAERQRNIARIEQREALRHIEVQHASLLKKLEESRDKATRLSREVHLVRTKLIRHQESLRKLQQFLKRHIAGKDKRVRRMATDLINAINAPESESPDLQTFEFEFEQSQKEFVGSLLERYAALTPTELRICIFTRLGLPLKQISEVMYISVDTVKTHRKHVRRKLGLKTGENLTSFLMGIR